MEFSPIRARNNRLILSVRIPIPGSGAVRQTSLCFDLSDMHAAYALSPFATTIPVAMGGGISQGKDYLGCFPTPTPGASCHILSQPQQATTKRRTKLVPHVTTRIIIPLPFATPQRSTAEPPPLIDGAFRFASLACFHFPYYRVRWAKSGVLGFKRARVHLQYMMFFFLSLSPCEPST